MNNKGEKNMITFKDMVALMKKVWWKIGWGDISLYLDGEKIWEEIKVH